MSTQPPPSPAPGETFYEDDGPAAPAPQPAGRERFALGREIGHGGMGRVVEATDRQFDRTVAVKLLTGVSAVARARFSTEAVVTGQLEHPAIPSVYERGQLANGTPYYAMHLARGRPLDVVLGEAGGLSERVKLLPVLVQVAQALGYAHEQGVVHRDIKPQNIIVGSHGRSFLLDWGIAKVRGRTTDGADTAAPETTAHTMHGSVLGTPAYMAPEQARGDIDAIDARTDVFALGAILYHLLSGHSPYSGPTADATLGAAVDVRFEPLSKVAPKAPSGLVAICEKAMSRTSTDRYADARDMAQALDGFLSSAVLARSTDRIDRFAQIAAAAGLLLVIGVTILVWTTVSSLNEQGLGALFYLLLAMLGGTLSIVEWWTRGRYALEPLTLALAGSTLLVGFTAAAVGVSLTLAAVAQPEVLADPMAGSWLLQGLFESLGNVPGSASLTAVQLVLWAVVRRTVAPTSGR